ncbi:DNA methyltransferase, partial [Pantoea ananatis]|uniref:DNA methyltransferase n=1 Tax=Pantoea ananas TaxID=553 RepID=UPI00215EDF6C
PDGSDEDILNLSDPPYYTACPNPWITDFIHEWEHSKPNTTDVLDYNREPLDMEINASRNNKFVNSHSYATKTPHQAIMQWILHYTNPGDIVLDMFSGTGMTAVAAQLCETPEEEFKSQIESEGRNIKWGARNAIIGDLGVAPTYIAKNLNYQDNYNDFVSEINEMERKIQEELGWMFKTKTNDGILVDIVAVLWSDIYICSNCTEEFSYWIAAVDENKGSVASEIICPHCNSRNNKNKLSKSWVNEYDPYLGTTIKKVKSEPSTIIYDYE